MRLSASRHFAAGRDRHHRCKGKPAAFFVEDDAVTPALLGHVEAAVRTTENL